MKERFLLVFAEAVGYTGERPCLSFRGAESGYGPLVDWGAGVGFLPGTQPSSDLELEPPVVGLLQ